MDRCYDSRIKDSCRMRKMRYQIFRHIVICLIFLFLNASAEKRDQWQQPEKVMDVIGVKKGMTIGIAGAGMGYFSFKMSERVGPSGRIYSNDIKENKLNHIKRRCERENIKNITTILGEVEDPLFPRGKMDMVFMCYVFHDLEKPVEFLMNIKKCLKHGSKVVILDQDPGKTGDHHFFTKKTLLRKVRAANYKVIRIETFLTKDSIYICQPKEEE